MLPTTTTSTVTTMPVWLTLRAEWSTVCNPAAAISSLLLDRHSDRAAPFGPRTVVVADVGVTQELVEHEPRVRGPLADAAVRDDLAVRRDALPAVDLLQLVVALERAVLGVDRGAPRDADGSRDVAAALGALLRQVLRCEQLARVLLRRADVDEAGLADLAHDVVLVCAELFARRAVELVRGLLDLRRVGRVRAPFFLPLDATAVDQLDLVVAVVLERPVRVGREPVVVVAVEDDVRVRRDAALAEQVLQSLLARDVARDLVLQVLPPVPADRAGDVPLLVVARVDVDLDQTNSLVGGVVSGPLGADERLACGCRRTQFQNLQSNRHMNRWSAGTNLVGWSRHSGRAQTTGPSYRSRRGSG